MGQIIGSGGQGEHPFIHHDILLILFYVSFFWHLFHSGDAFGGNRHIIGQHVAIKSFRYRQDDTIQTEVEALKVRVEQSSYLSA